MIIVNETDSPIAKNIILEGYFPEYLVAVTGELSTKIYNEADSFDPVPMFLLVYRYSRELGEKCHVYQFSGIRKG